MKTAFMVILSFSLFTATVFAGEPNKELHEKCIYPTVHITTSNHHGTGVIIKSTARDKDYENYVITVAHIIKFDVDKEKFEEHHIGVGEYEDWSKLVACTKYPMEKVLYLDTEKDIALVTFISLKPMPVADIATDHKLYIDDDVCRVGCGMDTLFRLDYGKITAVRGSLAPSSVKGRIRVNTPSVLGDSGGPTFDSKHKIIGLTESMKAVSVGHFSTFYIYHITFLIPIEDFTECPEIAKYLN